MENKNIRNVLKKFMDIHKDRFISDQEKWISKLNNVIDYIEKNNKIPSSKDHNETIRQMG